ncbi:MAG: PDZ domain-containing protein, partial [Candidatus Cloacimonetes bacterium]|nr:PDZ domain-containing protein [Candidatus Cloacimonadota bacterium]
MKLSRVLPFLLMGLLLMGADEPANRDEYMASMRENLQRFQKVYQYLVFRYVDEINPEATIEAAIHGMLDELDPYTDYFIEEEAESLDEMTRGEYGGLGMQVGQRGSTKRLTVISPFEDSPAWKAGLLPGDVITEIDGLSTTDEKLSDVVKHMKGEPGTQVTITVERPGYETPLVYTLTREMIAIQDLKFAGMIDKSQG